MTRLLVLGILDKESMSGYDIQQALQMTDAERWGGVLIGSIYHALKKMEREGYVGVTRIEQTGHRQKAIYSITESGQKYLASLVEESLSSSSVIYPSTLYSGISFHDKLSNEACRKALLEQQNKLDDELQAVQNGLKAKQIAMDHQIPPMVELIMENMFLTIKQQQDFIDKALRLLDNDH